MMALPTATDTELPVSPGEGRYLCGLLYRTLLEDPPVGNGELAGYLDVSGASVTEMIETFAQEGLVSYEPYKGAELTDRGERIAREILWRRCAVQRFFERSAGIELDDEQAYRIGCLLARSDVRGLSDRIDQPCEDYCEATEAADCDVLAT
jgi:DtxR family Mn-dependent transcriptional regulator